MKRSSQHVQDENITFGFVKRRTTNCREKIDPFRAIHLEKNLSVAGFLEQIAQKQLQNAQPTNSAISLSQVYILDISDAFIATQTLHYWFNQQREKDVCQYVEISMFNASILAEKALTIQNKHNNDTTQMKKDLTLLCKLILQLCDSHEFSSPSFINHLCNAKAKRMHIFQ